MRCNEVQLCQLQAYHTVLIELIPIAAAAGFHQPPRLLRTISTISRVATITSLP